MCCFACVTAERRPVDNVPTDLLRSFSFKGLQPVMHASPFTNKLFPPISNQKQQSGSSKAQSHIRSDWWHKYNKLSSDPRSTRFVPTVSMDRRCHGAFEPPVPRVDERLSPRRDDAPAHLRRHRLSARARTAGRGKLAGSREAVKHVSPATPQTDSQTTPRVLCGRHAAEHQARGNGLYNLTGQLLIGCYAFVGFHTFLLQFYPDVYSQLRYPPSFGHPLLLLPSQGSLWGWFFSYVNGSIQQFVMRGVLGSLIFICLLHLVRVVLHPIASAEDRHAFSSGSESSRGTDPRRRDGALRRLLRIAWSAQRRFHKRRARFCARLVAIVCLGLTVIQTSSFFFGGWTLKAIGFPDIYLGALTKPGGLWGHETATDIVLQHADMDSLSPEELKESLAELEEPRSQPMLVLIFLIGFALDAWGQYLQVCQEGHPEPRCRIWIHGTVCLFSNLRA